MAETDVIIPISVETEQATSSLGELSKAVSSAKKELKSAEQGSKEYDEAMKKLAIATDQLTRAEARQKDDLAKVSAAFKEAKQAADQQAAGFKNMAGEASQTASTLGQTAQAQAKNTEAMKNAEAQSASFRTQLKEMKDEMTQMILDGVKPTDKAFVDLATKAGELKDAIGDANATITLFASDTKQIDHFLRLTQSLASVFGTVSLGVSLFGGENEKLDATLKKVAATTAVVINIQTLSNNIRKQGTIENTLFTKANDLLTASLGRSTAASRIFLGIMGGGLLAAIALAISAITKYSGKLSEQKKQTDSLNEAVGNSLAVFRRLQVQWQTLGGDINAQKKFIKENASEFKELGLQINNVNDAEKVLTEYSDKIIAALALRAKAAALEKIATDEYLKGYKLQQQALEHATQAEKVYGDGHREHIFRMNQLNEEATKIFERTDQMFAESATLSAQAQASLDSLGLSRKSTTNTTDAATEAQNKYNEALELERQLSDDAFLLDKDQFDQRRVLEMRQYEERMAILLTNNRSTEDAERIHQANMAQIQAEQDAHDSKRILEQTQKKAQREKDDLTTRLQILYEGLNNEKLIGEDRIALERMVADTIIQIKEAGAKRSEQVAKANAAAEQKIDQQKVKNKEATLNAINALIELGQAAAGENTEAAKALGYAGAIVNTAAGAAAVLGDPTLPLFAKIAGMIAVLAAGGTQITAIANTKVPDYGQGSSSTSGSAPSTAVPIPIAQLTAPIVETHSNMTAAEVDEINQAQRVYVVESDIRDVVRRVEVNETESFF